MRDEPVDEEPPPFLSRWTNVYALVCVELGALLVVFYLLTRWATP